MIRSVKFCSAGPLPEMDSRNFNSCWRKRRGSATTGKVLPVGADYLLLRKDGSGALDVRATFESDDGALTYAPHSGVIDAGPDGQPGLRLDQPSAMPRCR